MRRRDGTQIPFLAGDSLGALLFGANFQMMKDPVDFARRFALWKPVSGSNIFCSNSILGLGKGVCVFGRKNLNALFSHSITVKKTHRILGRMLPLWDRLFGEGLFMVSGEQWKRQHRICLRAMGSRHKAMFFPAVRESARRTVRELSMCIKRFREGIQVAEGECESPFIVDCVRAAFKRLEAHQIQKKEGDGTSASSSSSSLPVDEYSDNGDATSRACRGYDMHSPLTNAARSQGAVPLQSAQLFSVLSLRVICAVAFGTAADANYVHLQLKRFVGATTEGIRAHEEPSPLWQLLDRIPGFLSLPIPWNKRRLGVIEALHAYCRSFLRQIKDDMKQEEEGTNGESCRHKNDDGGSKGERQVHEKKRGQDGKKEKKETPNLAKLLLHASDPTEGKLTENEVVMNVFSFMVC